MIRINGPIYNVRVSGLSLDCAGVADGIQADHPICSRFEDIQIRSPRSFGFQLQSTAPSRSGVAAGAGGNRISNVRAFIASGAPANGFVLGADNVRSIGSSANIWEQCSVLGGHTGFLLRFTDYIRLIMCQSYFSAESMVIEPPDGQPGFPTAIYVEHWSGDKPPVIHKPWKPAPNTGVVFTAYHREWNGGDPLQDASFGPPFPALPGFSGTDNRGKVYSYPL